MQVPYLMLTNEKFYQHIFFSFLQHSIPLLKSPHLQLKKSKLVVHHFWLLILEL